MIVKNENIRIVSEEQWEKVQLQIKRRPTLFTIPQLGGLGRIPRENPFSGMLKCGVCGGSIAITGQNAYGCVSHRQRDTCTNSLTIRVDRLEEQMVAFMAEKALSREFVEFVIEAFHKQIREKLARLQKESALSQNGVATLQDELRKLDYESRNIAEAIAQFGAYKSPTLLRQLEQIEQNSKIVTDKIKASKVSFGSVPYEKCREFLLASVQ